MFEQTDPDRRQVPNLDSFQQALKAAFDLHNSGRHGEAEATCRKLMQENPHDSQLLFLLGMVLQKTGKSEESLKHLEQAAELNPRSARVYNGLGFVHQSLKNHALAVQHYAKAIELGGQSADTFYSMGNACYQIGEVERAVSAFRNAVELAPRDVASWNNLGKCLNDLNRLDESLAAYDQAMAVDPQYSPARYGRALSLLAAGRLEEGFCEFNQWRSYGMKPRQFPRPIWQGEPISGKTLLLYAEQGYGDAIHYARFVRQARQRAAKVVWECRPELKTLFAYSGCADEVFGFGEPIPPFDVYAAHASLPGILGVTPSTIPNDVPYLRAPIQGSLPRRPGRPFSVGVAWAGNSSHHNNAARSICLEEFAPLLQASHITFYSLQTPIPAQDETCFQTLSGLVDLGEGFKDFLDTAKAVAEMDLVISVDTAIAHLAGALAKPVWTLLPFAPDWRWMIDRQDTPWYPTMRLFRQTKNKQWPPIIRKVAEELGKFSSGSGNFSNRPA